MLKSSTRPRDTRAFHRLLRKSRPTKAARRISSQIITGWEEPPINPRCPPEPFDTQDEDFGERIDPLLLRRYLEQLDAKCREYYKDHPDLIPDEERLQELGRFGPTQRLEFPRFARPGSAALNDVFVQVLAEPLAIAAEYRGLADWDEVADEALRVEIDGRTIYLFSYRDRLIQRAWSDYVGAIAERQGLIYSGAHGFRPKHSRFTAFAAVRKAANAGFTCAVSADIRGCFESIPIDLMKDRLRRIPEIPDDFVRIACWAMEPPVIRRPVPGKPTQRALTGCAWERPPGYVLQGSIIAPLIANIVLTDVLDAPFIAANRGVTLLRYADDLLLLARTPDRARGALESLEGILGQVESGPRLHPAKGARTPVDLRTGPIRWLGKDIYADGIVTPSHRVQELADAVVSARYKRELNQAIGTALAELRLDGPDTQRHFTALVGERDPNRKKIIECYLSNKTQWSNMHSIEDTDPHERNSSLIDDE